MSLSLAFTGVSSLWTAAFAATGPSVPLPGVSSTPVSRQQMDSRGADQASGDALHGDQLANATPAGESNIAATPISPSASWSVATQSGDFSWSYPLRVPPAPGGFEPDLALSYSSSAVDGHTSATNNQASWIGDGWSLAPGYVERAYGACFSDTEGGTTPPKNGDLCWKNENATALYGSGGGQLIRDDATGAWHPKSDDGSRVEKLTGADNGDNDGEYWKITTVDGTQYFFGSQKDAKSSWTVPVFGDDANEPCHAATFDASHCLQTWRWNLDKVVDRNGNVIRYTYEPEANSYGMNVKDAAVSYTRGGSLARADYGLREGSTAPATGRVLFTTADRCVPGSDCVPSKTGNWPDVPWDENCAAATCKDHYTPTFWSTKRLAKITAQVLRGSDYTDVDAWTLDQQFPDPGDGGKAALWLKGVTHTGLVGGSAALPAVTFEGVKLPNRVLKEDGVGPLIRYRVSGIVSETGGVTSVHYAPPDCTANAVPENNTQRCFQSKWSKKDWAERTDWFHKYVVDTVTTSDRISANPEQVTSYEYLDGAAWHFGQSEFVKDDKKTWDEFRGYGRVRVHQGKPADPAGPVTTTEERYYRGMDGDHLPGGTRAVSVTDSEGGTRPDADWLAGFPLESQTFNGDAVLTKKIGTPVWQGPTATHGALKSYFVGTGSVDGYTARNGGGWRKSRLETTYDDKGQPIKVDDLGDTATASDDLCVTTTYARDNDLWLMTLPSRVETVSVHCGTTPVFPDNAVTDDLTTYDGRGNAIKEEALDAHPASGPHYVTKASVTYDDYGRLMTASDALGRTAKTEYTGLPVTATKLTNALGQVTTSTLEPAWGLPVKVTDPNQRVAETRFDPLGRVAEAWLPNRPRADNAGNAQFTYLIRNDGPSVITTSKVGPNGNYTSSNTLYDGLARVRQVQQPTNGGRLLVDTRYDSQGRQFKTTQPYFNDGAVDDKLWVASDTEVPGLTFTEYDAAGRVSASIQKAAGQEKWRTTTTYDADRTNVTPPRGATPATTIVDARGRTTELWQYHGTTADGEHDVTKYGYTPSGQQSSLTDPAGNTWRWTYDLLGRQVRSDDVDRGTSRRAYDDAGQLVSATDGRNTTLSYVYDKLGRKTETHSGAATGPLVEKFTYDTVPFAIGKLASSTRYVGGTAYTSSVDAYSPLYQPMQTTTSIPQPEGLLAGNYTSYLGYNPDGSVKGEAYAAAGGLPAETLMHVYDDLGRPTTSSGGYDGNTDEFVTGTDYTRYGEPQRIQLGDTGKRAWLSYYYDTNTRRLNRSIVDAEVPAPMQDDLNYAYDPAGNITSIADTPQGRAADVQCFAYDYLRRLSDAWTPSGGCAATRDAATLNGPAPYWQSFTYDKVGNRLTAVQHGKTGNVTQTSSYPASGHLVQSVKTEGTQGGPSTTTYGYDAAGNTTARAGQQLEWDAEGHLTKVTEAGVSTEFLYDASGTRLIRRDPTGSTLYLPGQELRADKATARVTVSRYYTHGGKTVAVRTAKGISWLADDHQGTPRLAIDSATLKVTPRRQDPFGSPRGPAADIPGDRGFVGGTEDTSIGLTGVGAREYDAASGRFLSTDPLLNPGDPQQLQGYAYANNSPVSFSDPSGMIASGPDGECAKFCAYKPGHNPATNSQPDLEWNVHNCPSGEYYCKAQHGHGPKTKGCPDGAKSCNYVKGTKAPWEIRQEEENERAKQINEAIRKSGMIEHIPEHGWFEISNVAKFETGSICLQNQIGALVEVGWKGCVNWDNHGITFSGGANLSLTVGGGEKLSFVLKLSHGAMADQVDSGISLEGKAGFEGTLGLGAGLQGGVDAAIVGGPSTEFLQYEFTMGAHVSVASVGLSGGLNSGYVIRH
ncbi:RHS repeat-associated core domain-containing protein [Amycolatopsis balhimycina]|uniref:RHS repeat-associated core domain-containing protein n=1 Tax=Amycolatopsis balhimycina TaxID=208443 RepID=UPI001FDF7E97|nr:RHS repeat-associated core domain-containing protein [Amycolatopsis balhimycina]